MGTLCRRRTCRFDCGNGLPLREITLSGGHAGGLLGPQHFGLDQAERISFRIIWPDGAHSEWAKSKPNQGLQVIRSGDALDTFTD